MAKNIVFSPGYRLAIVATHPAVPKSGQPCRFGVRTGIALVDEKANGKTTVDFGPFVAEVSVKGIDDSVNSPVAVGDAIFYVDADVGDGTGFLDKKGSGYFFGFALATVGSGSTATIQVAHSPSPGAGTLGAGTIAEAHLVAASLSGVIAKVVANANAIGGLPVLHRIDVPDATGDTDVTLTHKTRVIDAWGLNTGIAAHATTDTWQVKNGANAISDAVAKTATVNAIKRIATIDPARAEIAAAGVLRISAVKTTNAAVTVYVLGIRVSE